MVNVIYRKNDGVLDLFLNQEGHKKRKCVYSVHSVLGVKKFVKVTTSRTREKNSLSYLILSYRLTDKHCRNGNINETTKKKR